MSVQGGIDFGGTAHGSTAVGATMISAPGQPSMSANAIGAPGSRGVGSSMAVHQAACWLIFGSLAGLIVIGYVFRRGPITD